MYTNRIERGDLFLADLRPVQGSEQGGIRPVLVLQNDIGNRHSPTLIVAAVTSRKKAKIPIHVELEKSCGLFQHSVVLLEQIRTIDKGRLKKYIGYVDAITMRQIDRALAESIGLIQHDALDKIGTNKGEF